ncbi:hypothetical protein GCM10028805_55580 [Spirosoma harenae]
MFTMVCFIQVSSSANGADLFKNPKRPALQATKTSILGAAKKLPSSSAEHRARAIVSKVNNELDEIKFIPADSSSAARADLSVKADSAKSIISGSPLFKVKNYTKETNPIPQVAIDRLPNETTIRFFHPDDEAKAVALKTLLVEKKLYPEPSISIESMLSKIKKTIPNYIEIWIRRK